jgi:lipoate-protein ligase A
MTMSQMHPIPSRLADEGQLDDGPHSKLAALERLIDSLAEPRTPPGDVRLLIERAPASGARNMAVDEALLDSVAAGSPAVLRIYRWAEATISTGYFQRETPEIEPGGRFYGLPAVRRLSGGGAILHHREITYSCCIPGGHPLAGEPTLLYEQIHRRICEVLAEFGLSAEPRGAHEGGEKPFLCFARGDRRDLVCQGFKVVGSAQRRRGAGVLQHGSILLRRSPLLPEFPGLLDLARREVPAEPLMERLARHLGEALGDAPREVELADPERAAADLLEQTRYGSER